MGLFGNIKKALLGSAEAGQPPGERAPSPEGAKPSLWTGLRAMTTLPDRSADVETILEEKAKRSEQPLYWRSSVIDLLDLLDLDSRLAARMALARELGFTGDLTDTTELNDWLHKQVMRLLAQSPGVIPDALK